ncbi:protein kinase domain-containing protein [Lusitaniella coriacea]|uniref:protein kinase domain-containing protein n=1 Tax=Lusitaniella coriacea TaxID=1983105 RepID=UPI003CE81EB7
MEILCTRPGCTHPRNFFADLDEEENLKMAQQKYCTTCGMSLILGGRYIILKLLGRGGFGAAFLARDRYTTSLRECVVKQFQPSGDLNPQQLQMARKLFEREAAVLEELGNEHPQIPNSYAFFQIVVPSIDRAREEQFFYLVQEFVDGQDLEAEQKSRGRSYSEAEVREVLEEILNVLKFVHNRNAIHRDIKPSNIMRDKNGRLYLLDFGAVKQVAAGAGAPQGRSTGIYSMGFAPPEQMHGSQVYPSTDLYALGITCLVLLTNKLSEELYDSANNCWNWRSSAPQTSDRLAEILDRMLLSAPIDRFQSAQEALDALHSQPFAPPSAPPSPPPVPPKTPGVPTPSPQAAPTTPPPIVPTPSPSPVRRAQPRFSLLEILGCAGFTGFEGALFAIALTSIFGISPVSVGLLGALVGGSIYVQYRRMIEGKDLPILAGITLVLVGFVPWLNKAPIAIALGEQMPLFLAVALIAALLGVGAIAVTALFRLIYQILARIL